MRRAIQSSVWAFLLATGSCALVADIQEGTPQCMVVADCTVDVPECRQAKACEDSTCIFTDMPEGTPLATQTSGDCTAVVCDGAGKTKLIPASMDVLDDGNPCTIDTCNGVTPAHTLATELPCYTGPAGTQDNGICKGGMQQCDGQGKPIGTCAGEVVPADEVCDATLRDENCDGKVNEGGLNCVCGDGYLSMGEECDDGNLVGSDACSATCRVESALPFAGGDSTCAILYNNMLKCWGQNYFGQLGLDNTDARGDAPNEMGANLPVVNIGPVAKVAVTYHVCAILLSGAIKCWGLNGFGQLGLGNTVNQGEMPNQMSNLPVVSLIGKYTAIAVGPVYSCALRDDGALYCWGVNAQGQLGLGDTNPRGDNPMEMGNNLPAVDLGTNKKVMAVTLGGTHTCALLDDGAVKCWGDNVDGQLGVGLDKTYNIGDAFGEMGNALKSVDLGIGKVVKAISAGSGHTCALMAEGSVKCWGNNSVGQLGIGNTLNRGNNVDEMGDNLPAVDLGDGKIAIAISTGDFHTCALLNDSTTKCWGGNDEGQLGLGDNKNRGDEPNEMGDNLFTVDLGTGVKVTAVSAGSYHTCARVEKGNIRCWGAAGQLGLGIMDNRGDNPNEMGNNLPAIKLFSDAW